MSNVKRYLQNRGNLLYRVQERVKCGLWAKPKFYDILKKVPPQHAYRNKYPRLNIFPETQLLNRLFYQFPEVSRDLVLMSPHVTFPGRFVKTQWRLMKESGLSEKQAFERTWAEFAPEIQSFRMQSEKFRHDPQKPRAELLMKQVAEKDAWYSELFLKTVQIRKERARKGGVEDLVWALEGKRKPVDREAKRAWHMQHEEEQNRWLSRKAPTADSPVPGTKAGAAASDDASAGAADNQSAAGAGVGDSASGQGPPRAVDAPPDSDSSGSGAATRTDTVVASGQISSGGSKQSS